MPTKKILLRGISRTPSDRMSADGGLAESIGFEMNENELATSVPAVNVTDDTLVGEYTDGDYEVLYIHKTNSYNHYIGTHHTVTIVEEQEVHHKYVGWFAPTPTFYNFLEYEPDETVKEIKSVGNTLIILIADLDGNTKRMEYVLFKDGGYHSLGSQIPEPRIRIESELTPAYGETGADEWEHGQFSRIYSELVKQHSNPDIWEIPWTQRHDDNWHSDEDNYAAYAQGVYEFSLGCVNRDLTHNLERGCFNAPVFLRYAIRLYDGTYVRHSAPVLVRGVDDLNNLEFNFYGDITTLSSGKRYTYVRRRRNSDPDDPGQAFDWLVRPYFINLFLDSTTATAFADWKDIVSGVDVFISPEINMISPKVGSITDYWEDSSHIGVIYHGHVLSDEEIRDEILSKSNFYKFLRIDYNELISRDPSEEYCTVGLEDFRQDILVTKERLTDDTKQTNNYLIPHNIKVYNERLLAIGAQIQHYNGYYNLPSRVTVNSQSTFTMHLRYYIRTTSGREVIVDRTYAVNHIMSLGNWLFYPDPRCYRCIVSVQGVVSVEFEMTEHPYLNGAYCLTSFDNVTLIEQGGVVSYPTDTLNDLEQRSNVLFQYEFPNFFTPSLEQSFPYGELIDLAVVTKALSTGQFGYSSLYIFSTEGLWAIAVNKDGSMGKPDAVSNGVPAGSGCGIYYQERCDAAYR